MNTVEQLEARKKELQLQRQIAWMEREKQGMSFLKKASLWVWATGLPWAMILCGAAWVYADWSTGRWFHEAAVMGMLFLGGGTWLLHRQQKA